MTGECRGEKHPGPEQPVSIPERPAIMGEFTARKHRTGQHYWYSGDDSCRVPPRHRGRAEMGEDMRAKPGDDSSIETG